MIFDKNVATYILKPERITERKTPANEFQILYIKIYSEISKSFEPQFIYK